MPDSKINLADIELKYDSLADLSNFAQKVKWNASIKNSYIALSDLSAFSPNFKGFKQAISVQGLISGRISSLRFQKMKLKYGNHSY